MSETISTRTKAFVRHWFPWVTWGQKARSVALGTALLVVASLLSFWAYGRLCIMQSVFRLAGAANLAEQRHWSRSAIGSLKIPLN